VLAVLLVHAALIAGCGRASQEPVTLERSIALSDDTGVLQPLRLQVVGDTVFVSYKGVPRLDKYSLDLERVGSIELTDPVPVMPSAFAVGDSQIVVADHGRGAVVLYDRKGELIDSFGLLPDQQTRLLPLALAWFQGVAYVADMALKEVLAISTAATADVVEQGELVLRVPGAGNRGLGMPSAVFVTPDGRLLVGDSGTGSIRVFTCDGREVYSFDPLPEGKIAPQGFALDDVPDPELSGSAKSDPSGVKHMGHIHVADGRSGQVHVFNALGHYVASYSGNGVLEGPTDVTVSWETHRVFVADSRAKRVHVFSYGEDR